MSNRNTIAKQLLTRYGWNGFIVPKALIFASNWLKIREALTYDLITLIDCKKVWKEVKLEQVVYVSQNNSASKFYRTGCRNKHQLVVNTDVDKKNCTMFGLLICGITKDEILLGRKIHERSEKLGKYVKNSRGCMLQSKVRESGTHKVLGGTQIQRYRIARGWKGYLQTGDLDSKAQVVEDSILAQRIVAHIKNPTEHLKITATIPTHAEFVILDTINQITVNGPSPYYVLGLLNSKITNWYTYRFIFGKAIRTMQFDNPTTDRIPIIIKQENTVVQGVKELIRLHKEDPPKAHTNDAIASNENALNRLFYDIFGLTGSEIEMIENTTPA